MLNGENYQVVKYKIKIKDYLTTNQAVRLQNLHAQTACKGSSPSPPCIKLQHITLHEQGDFKGSPWPPCKLLQIYEQDDENMQSQSIQSYEENELPWLQNPWEVYENVRQEHVYSNTSSQAIPPKPLKLHPSTVQEKEEASCARSPCKLQEIWNEGEEEIQKAIEEEKAGGGVWEGVKKIECECCGMEEECTGGYEQKVRAGLRGHWLCGLCEEAVGEERKRVGGSVQAALAAHMQPCRRFSRRARSKASPPASDVAVPHAVCRLLCRHLSTLSPHSHSSSSPSAFLSRSSSCLPSLNN